jgi:signal transduction histidine kinase/ligand-binding sensor domain-containing protein
MTTIRVAAALIIVTSSGFALDPSSPTNSYIRDSFTVENGLPSNVVNAIVQTRNGFLWVGTDAGLAGFNGKRFTPIYFRAPPPAPQGVVSALVEGPDGDLWVGTGTGIARIARRTLDSPSLLYSPGTGLSDQITRLHFTGDGTLWVGTYDGLYRFRNGAFVRVLPGMITRIEEASHGHLFIVASGRFVEWDGTQMVEHSEFASRLGIHNDWFEHVLKDGDGATWFCSLGGLARIQGDRIQRFAGYGREGRFGLSAQAVYIDRQGVTWVQFSSGVFRVSTSTPELLVRGSIREIYSDREGDLWVAENGEGLIRFKDRLVRMFTQDDGLPGNIVMAVLSRRDGSLWVGNNCGGISVFEKQRFHTYAEKSGLTNSCVWALAEDPNDDLWVGTWGGGLYRFSGGHFTQFSKPEGLPGDVVRGIEVGHDGSLWIAVNGGLSHMRNGRFRNYTTADGLSSNNVLAVYQDRAAGIWVGTSRGIDRMTGDRFVPVPSASDISDPRVMSFKEDPSGRLYVMGASRGINGVEGNRLVNIDQELDLFSTVAFRENLWFSGGNGLFRFPRTALQRTDKEQDLPLDYTSFGSADGMNSTQCSVGSPNMAITREGKLWVATVKGLAELDLQKLQSSTRKPVTFITEVTVERTKQIAGSELVLPHGTHHTEIHFDSVSLSSPEKIRFQYRMDGVDSLWLDSDNLLTAVYSNIPSGNHSFHVRACNSDGVWDPIGIVYPVTQEPYVYETTLFRVGLGTALTLLLALAYWLRVQNIQHQYSLLLDGRVSERTRIARELHDTLLQSFHGLILRFQAARNMLPEREAQAGEALDIAIDRAAEAITEGRNAVQELRVDQIGSDDLIQILNSLGQQLGADHADTSGGKTPATFRVLAEGKLKPMHSMLRDDLYRIAREAVGNAFRHARASQIEVDVRYGRRMLRLRVRDDGIGMNANVLAHGGTEGHWGLRGMRERARRIGGKLEVWSECNRGTEVELTIPAAIAFRKSGYRQSSNISSRKRFEP